MSPTDSVKRVLQILRGIYHPKGIVVPDPVQALCSRWGQDKFSYGSYSYVAVGSSGDDYDILAESVGDGRVFFAGEATNKQYPATMHGAFLSGMREAANILRVARRRASESASNLANILGFSSNHVLLGFHVKSQRKGYKSDLQVIETQITMKKVSLFIPFLSSCSASNHFSLRLVLA
ncbi:hypothetical protein F2Q68_00019601 [Brassica cretica]|uniref:Amine oxidase domain-containing protein n=1 Tax=Brassica cretica TaxID=69181 RepID=A0A8S9G0Z7_BRACR|nr:hypothetical protein F2Q68_00019601 [Brassica cretica]